MTTIPGIEIRSIGLRLDTHTVFDNLTLSVAPGRWHCLLGRSGVGKSSLLRLLGGLQSVVRGSITIDNGEPLTHRVAYMSQDDGLLPWLTVLDNVQLGPRLRRRADADTERTARTLLAQVGLSDWADALPTRLSGGMRQRVALARTLLEDRPVVLMDEPFSRLDAVTRNELQSLAFRLLDGRTVVLVTHDPLEALRLCHTVTVLQCGSPARLAHFEVEAAPPRRTDDPTMLARLPELWQALVDDTSEPSGPSGSTGSLTTISSDSAF